MKLSLLVSIIFFYKLWNSVCIEILKLHHAELGEGQISRKCIIQKMLHIRYSYDGGGRELTLCWQHVEQSLDIFNQWNVFPSCSAGELFGGQTCRGDTNESWRRWGQKAAVRLWHVDDWSSAGLVRELPCPMEQVSVPDDREMALLCINVDLSLQLYISLCSYLLIKIIFICKRNNKI